jgi:uncharacterized protein YndB with AHSA1/START domain/uncharacterized damage-inducible protein DinB
MATTASATSLEIRRRIAAPREKVYQAWTDPALIGRWFGPSDDYTATVHQLDVRVGGRYRIAMRHKDGQIHVATGSYREVSPSDRLVFTWKWEDHPEMPETLVTIALASRGTDTELILSHQLFESEEQAKEHEKGWGGTLDRLARALAPTASTSTPSPIAASLLQELTQEAATTRRVLERVPGDRLGWRPHPKSMSLGQLALHVATTPGGITQISQQDTFELPGFNQPEATSSGEIMTAFDQSVAAAREMLSEISDERLAATWTATRQGKAFFVVPRVGLFRAIMLNHWYHHRGQLCVYLRLLDVPVPSVYGPSADEAPAM